MSKFLIIGINLTGKRVLVVGAGKIGIRKIMKIIKYNPQITVLSPKIQDDQKGFFKKNNIKIINDVYKRKYLKNFNYVIAATNDCKLNDIILKDCNKRNILVNNVSNKNLTDIIFTFSINLKKFVVAFSTQGNHPKLLKLIRRVLKCFGLRE